MAATRKKKAQSTSSSRRTTGTRSTARGSAGKGRRNSADSIPKPIRRGVGAWVCLLLAIFSALGCFRVQAVFIDFFCGLLKGLFGYGFWLATPMLLLASYIHAFHRGRPVRLRLSAAFLFPVIMGAVFHSFLASATFGFGRSILKELWTSGLVLQSGGAVSGMLAISFIKAFSKPGALIIFILSGILILLVAFDRTIVDIVDYIQSRPHPDYEVTPPPEKKKREKAQPAAVPAERTAASFDIPVEDGPLLGKPQEPVLAQGKKSFFNRTPSVKRPDEVLAGPAEPEVIPPSPIPEPPAPEPVPEPTIPPEPPKIVREPAVQKPKREETEQAAAEVARDITSTLEQSPSAYQYPPVSLLLEGSDISEVDAAGELRANQERLAETIRSFGIEAKISGVIRGPSVTRYEVELEQGVRLNKLTNLADDIALALGATGVRIAPIPEKISMVGIEVPNKLVSPVYIHDVISSTAFTDNPSKVSFAVGKDIGGNDIIGNIAKLPHLLIAGTTGSGKSVCTNSLIISLLYKATPDEVRLIMVDPKMVELGIYNGIPHLLIPVVTDPKKAAGALQWAVTEMMKRYRTFAGCNVRDLAAYNSYAAKTEGMSKLPQVVVVIDELADLMLVAAKEVEESICRVAQMGRAAGMHLIIATQRPSADVITGLMKANIPSRIAFAVASAMESRIILDTQGAEKLVGRGDMLWFPLGAGKPLRVQGTLISDEEVAAVVAFVKKSGTAEYDEEIIHEIEQHVEEKEKGAKGIGGTAPEGADNSCDELLPAAVDVVLETGMASVSMLQRRLKLGYSRAARLVDQMEEKGIVGPFEGSKPRQVLITKEQWQELQFRNGIADTAPDAVPEPEAPPFDAGESD